MLADSSSFPRLRHESTKCLFVFGKYVTDVYVNVRGFYMFGVDGKTKVVAGSREVMHALFHFRFSVDIESAVIPNAEFSPCVYLDLCV